MCGELFGECVVVGVVLYYVDFLGLSVLLVWLRILVIVIELKCDYLLVKWMM